MFLSGKIEVVSMYHNYQIFKNKCVTISIFMFTSLYPGLITGPCSCVVLSSDHLSCKFVRFHL